MRTSLIFLGALGVLAVQIFTSPAAAKDRPPHPRQMGQTRYRVDYTVRSKEEMVGANLFAALGRLIHKDQKKGETTVSYEFVGTRPDAFINLELGVRDIGPGDYALRVAVTDQNASAKTERETAFWIQK